MVVPQAGRREGAMQAADVAGISAILIHWIGAFVSVGLIVGVSVWGYRLAARDVTEIPVIHAMTEPMRVLPEDPGGQQVEGQGLAINAVQAGQQTPPPDQVVLAPPPVTLTPADRPGAQIPGAAGQGTQVDFVKEAISSLQDTSAATPPAASGAGTDAAASFGLGPARSLRPRARPLSAAAAGDIAAPVAGGSVDVSPEQVTPGSRLVQLGAFDDRASAIAGWNRLMARHGALLGSKKRLIQEARSGGRSFYRLRAVGFESLADTRQFCSALLAANTPCIPVTAR